MMNVSGLEGSTPTAIRRIYLLLHARRPPAFDVNPDRQVSKKTPDEGGAHALP